MPETSSSRLPVVVIGLGNLWMCDEGIGPRIVQELAKRSDLDGIELLDLGTAGFDVLHAIRARQKAVLIDCAYMQADPGTLLRFTPDEARSQKALSRPSLHEGDLMRTIELSRELGECPPEVVLFGIEPERVESGLDLSDSLASRLSGYVDRVLEELA